MDAVAQANPNVYTQLSSGHDKQFEKRAWKFEHSSYLLDEMDEGVQLNQDGILESKNSTDEFAGEISLMKREWVLQRPQQQQAVKLDLA